MKRAFDWVEYLVKHYDNADSGPTTTHDAFLGILKAARKCASDRKDILNLASKTFQYLKESRHVVDPLAYSCLLQIVLQALSRPESDNARTEKVTQIVQDCCEDGLVSKGLVRALTNGPVYESGWTLSESEELTTTLFPDWPLPPSWTRNISNDAVLPTQSDFQRTKHILFKHGQNPPI